MPRNGFGVGTGRCAKAYERTVSVSSEQQRWAWPVATRCAHVLGDAADRLEIEFTERTTGNASPLESPLMDAIDRWVRASEPSAETVPLILPGFSDSRWFRETFPECIAYGFFPTRNMTLLDTSPLVHNADERIDVRDLGFATACYRDLARDLLG